MSGQFSCFGLSILGTCLYNPAQPAPTYFTLGNAISALGFTLAIQQFLKPIYSVVVVAGAAIAIAMARCIILMMVMAGVYREGVPRGGSAIVPAWLNVAPTQHQNGESQRRRRGYPPRG